MVGAFLKEALHCQGLLLLRLTPVHSHFYTFLQKLMASLDFDNGGELANNLFALYNWFNRELLSSNISRDTKRIKSVRNMMDDLRQAWQEIVAKTSAESSGRAQQGVHIAG